MSNFLPSKLVSTLKQHFDIDAEEFINVHESGEQITSVRVNPAKRTEQFKNLPKVPWCHQGYYLNERPSFTLDPLFHAGAYYVQEASSMFISHIIRTLHLSQEPLIALDLCAAPGGKSTLLNSFLHPESLLVANELIKTRVNTLADNLTKWGNHNVIVTNNDPSAFSRLPGYFDLMLVDAPCSGSGMFRKDNQAINEWSESAVNLCSQRQQRILANSLSALKENGILLYATCSYSIEENEQIADWLIDEHNMKSIHIPMDTSWGIEETKSPRHKCYGYRFYPNRLKGEGFFISCFVKTAAQHTFNRRKVKNDKKTFDKSIIKNWLSTDVNFLPINFKDDVLIIPERNELDFRSIQQVLYLKKAGTTVGKTGQKELIPSYEFALSNLKSEQIPRLELSLEEALNYLRKTELTVSSTSTGWTLACYNGFALGWIKVLSNRINNYYPKEWRILNL